MKRLRIALAGFLHESNTFLGVPTTYENFVAASLTRGQALLERWSGAHHELGGFLDVLAAGQVEIVPLLATFAVPSGTVAAEAYERIAAELLEDLRAALPLDGLLLALHGATVSEEFPDADGELLRRVRESAGPELPIVTTLDLHANVSAQMIAHAHATVAYRSNPHLDQRERGREAAGLLLRMLRGEIRPVQALETPPMLIAISKQHTASEPARLLYDDLREVLQWPGILSASATMGFYYADVEEMGAAFFAVADGDRELARKAARHMADRAWARRADLTAGLPSVSEAVAHAIQAARAPVTIMDVGDNVGAGSPADSTILFEEILRRKGRNAMVILCDPEAVAQCLTRGVGQRIRLRVGGKTDSRHGAPVEVEGMIRTLSDGHFEERQVRHGGWGVCEQGLTAVVETPEEHTVVLTSRRMAPMSLEQVLSLGIHPERKQILIAKGVVAPRAAYEPVSAEIVLADTPGVTSDNPRHFDYRRRRRPLYPLEEAAAFSR
ncbi:MAG: M81 family metallopeptidase [Bryobacterales bacterium]|nr:M81 family metallopeptidase [Bryobacterales bacterium]